MERLEPWYHERGVRADADAAGRHERPAIDFQHIDRTRAATDDPVERTGDVVRDPVRAREVIPRSERNDAEWDAGARELLGDQSNGTIAAHGDDDRGSLLRGHARTHDFRRLERRADGDDLDTIATTESALGRLAPLAASNAPSIRVRDDKRRRGGAGWRWAV